MSLKIKGSYDTEIYVSEGGYVAIKQPDPQAGDDTIVLLSAAQLPAVISELQALYDERTSWDNPDGDRVEESTAESEPG